MAVLLGEISEAAAELRGDLALAVNGESVELVTVPHLFKRAVLNLVTNAVRHAQKRVEMSCRLEGEVVYLCVDDDGPGVPEAAREKIFEPFFRLDESRSADLGGAGLGLAIVRRIAQLHGGQVRVEDSPLGGARFTLSLPREVACEHSG